MMHAPRNLKFTRDHEWVRVKGHALVVGMTDFAQHQLSHIINVDLPAPDEHHHYDGGAEVGVLESVKAAADFHAPVSGIVTAVNPELLHAAELINSDPYGAGWLFQMKPDAMADIEDLMDLDDYEGSLPDDSNEE